jgi:FkbM family methyltransferase
MKNKLIKLLNLIAHPRLLKHYLLFNTVASFEHKDIIKNTINCKTVIDIGANKGQFSLLIKELIKDVKIISFEPLPGPSKKYNKIFKSNNDVKLFNAAIGPQKMITQMHVSKKDDSSSILPIGKAQQSIFKGTEESHIQEISVAPLDNFIDESDLIAPIFVKIDVQGFELEVLKGCGGFLTKFNYIYVECSFIELYEKQAFADEVITFLNNYSFKLKGVYNTFYDKKGIAVQADLLFSKR